MGRTQGDRNATYIGSHLPFLSWIFSPFGPVAVMPPPCERPGPWSVRPEPVCTCSMSRSQSLLDRLLALGAEEVFAGGLGDPLDFEHLRGGDAVEAGIALDLGGGLLVLEVGTLRLSLFRQPPEFEVGRVVLALLVVEARLPLVALGIAAAAIPKLLGIGCGLGGGGVLGVEGARRPAEAASERHIGITAGVAEIGHAGADPAHHAAEVFAAEQRAERPLGERGRGLRTGLRLRHGLRLGLRRLRPRCRRRHRNRCGRSRR